jgi:hypothetical protein
VRQHVDKPANGHKYEKEIAGIKEKIAEQIDEYIRLSDQNQEDGK